MSAETMEARRGPTTEEQLEMANGCLAMIAEVLAVHLGEQAVERTPPMFYPEAIQSAIQKRQAWQPIETAPRDGSTAVFWIVPVQEHEARYADTSGNPMFGTHKPYMEMTVYGRWSSLSRATHWMPLPAPPEVVR